jgi:site-specific recombinase XerD
MRELERVGGLGIECLESGLPELIRNAGTAAGRRFLEFFTAALRNPNTREAYARAAVRFCEWCEARRLLLSQVQPIVVAAYIEELGRCLSKPSVKQHLAALRMLFDHLVLGQILPMNPASSVRGPKHVVKRGKTPVLAPEDARALIESIDITTLLGLRDRALIGVMVYSFARIGAVTRMNVEDYYQNGKRWWLRLHEKGGRFHEVPVHHKAEEYLDAYLRAANLNGSPKTPLFRTVPGRTGRLTDHRLNRREALKVIKRRAKAAGLSTRIGNHTFRATGITTYLLNGGSLENAQAIAGHESPRTTKLYDRTRDEITLEEVERIRL